MTHVKKSGPIREAMSKLNLVSGLGISLTYSKSIFVSEPFRNSRYALDAWKNTDEKKQIWTQDCVLNDNINIYVWVKGEAKSAPD